ncbi:MAG: GGDEF domain-containing protein [Deltaproteobacteria bacterium]|nr:GGDEF domain-containing protein [Deltaproteobacteria bacterium]
MKDSVLFSSLDRRLTVLKDKSFATCLLELSALIAKNQFRKAIALAQEITNTDAAFLNFKSGYFSRPLSQEDQALLCGEREPKLGRHQRINSVLKGEVLNLCRFEVNAFSEHDQTIAAKVDAHLKEDLIRFEEYYALVHDPQTGFYARERFFDFFEHEFHRSWRYQAALSLVLIDIDGFSRTTHPEAILTKTAGRIKSEVRQGDFVARLSNDTFAIIEPMTALQRATKSSERILSKFKHLPVLVQETPLQVHLSMGVASLLPKDQSQMDILTRADRALQAAKRLGGNRVVVFDSMP